MDWLRRKPEWVRASLKGWARLPPSRAKDLALGPARQIGAGPARRQEELRYACAALVGHGLFPILRRKYGKRGGGAQLKNL